MKQTNCKIIASRQPQSVRCFWLLVVDIYFHVMSSTKSNMYDSWTIGGLPHTGCNRSKSTWFDNFEDWLRLIAIAYLKKLPGKKKLIDDNLSFYLLI